MSTPIAFSEEERRLRAELGAELGWYPADLDDESIARPRADAARKKTDRDPAKRWAHLTELARQCDVEAAGRAAVADLYEREGNWGTKTLRMDAVWPLVFPCATPTLNSSPTASP